MYQQTYLDFHINRVPWKSLCVGFHLGGNTHDNSDAEGNGAVMPSTGCPYKK